jgi:hypothetical protein
LYAEYEDSLREADSLDFDDLLVFGLRLFRTAPNILASCRHILVDEFQVSGLRSSPLATAHQHAPLGYEYNAVRIDAVFCEIAWRSQRRWGSGSVNLWLEVCGGRESEEDGVW